MSSAVATLWYTNSPRSSFDRWFSQVVCYFTNHPSETWIRACFESAPWAPSQYALSSSPCTQTSALCLMVCTREALLVCSWLQRAHVGLRGKKQDRAPKNTSTFKYSYLFLSFFQACMAQADTDNIILSSHQRLFYAMLLLFFLFYFQRKKITRVCNEAVQLYVWTAKAGADLIGA